MTDAVADFGQDRNFDRPHAAPPRASTTSPAAQRCAERQHVLAGRRIDLLQPHGAIVDQLGLFDGHDGVGPFGQRRAGHDPRRRAGRDGKTRHGAGGDFFQDLPLRLAIAARTA